MTFGPLPTVSPPAGLTFGQMSFRGVTFGGLVKNGTYQIQSLPSGIDGPAISTGDQQRPADQGEFKGLDVYAGRDITVTQIAQAATALLLEQARQTLGAVMVPAGSTEYPLYLQLASGMYACMARPRKHNFPWDINTILGPLTGSGPGGVTVTSLFHATDPRFYLQPSKSATVGLPAPLGGATFPATFPLSFGGGGVGGILDVFNNGTIEMRPVLVVNGPCTNPTIANLSISGSPQIQVLMSLNAGDTLTIDTDFPSVLYTPAGSTISVSRANLLSATNTWWNLQPANGPSGIGGPNIIEFTTSDAAQVAATLTVQSADALANL